VTFGALLQHTLLKTQYSLSVLFHIFTDYSMGRHYQYFDTVGWLGLLTCKNRLPYNLYCVGGDVKHCSLTHSLTHYHR